jgi:hypothetical protein
MAYTNKLLVEAMRGAKLTDDQTTMLALLQEVADDWIDNEIGTTFRSSGEATRYYEGGRGIIPIDPVRAPVGGEITVSSVDGEGDITTIHEETYRLMPLNSETKTYLEVGANLSGYHWSGEVIPDFVEERDYIHERVAITGEFSHSDNPPETVQWLATYIVCKYLARPIEGSLQSESIEGYQRQYAVYATKPSFFDEPAQLAIQKLKRQYQKIRL